MFWHCGVFESPRQAFSAFLQDTFGKKTSFPLAERGKARGYNGVCPQDSAMVECVLGLPSELNYPTLPPWRPASDRLYLSDEGETFIATDGGIDLPTDQWFLWRAIP